MIDPVDRAVRAIARRNSYALVLAPHGIAHLGNRPGPTGVGVGVNTASRAEALTRETGDELLITDPVSD